jgi:hypothetical protein
VLSVAEGKWKGCGVCVNVESVDRSQFASVVYLVSLSITAVVFA